MAAVIPDVVPREQQWNTVPATSDVNMNGYSISGLKSLTTPSAAIDASGGIVGTSVLSSGSISGATMTSTGIAAFKTNMTVGDNAAGAGALTVRSQTGSGVSQIFLTDGSSNASLNFNASQNKLAVTANRLTLNGGTSVLDMGGNTGAASIVGAGGTSVFLNRDSNTKLTLDSSGIVRIGDVGLTTVPSLKFQGVANDGNIQYVEASDKLEVTGADFNVAGGLTTNSNLALSFDATNGGKIMTKTLTNLGIGTNGTAMAIQIGATGNVGIGKSASVALDVNGQVSCTGLLASSATVSGASTMRNMYPFTDNTYALGASSLRWNNCYTHDGVTGFEAYLNLNLNLKLHKEL